MVVNAPAPAAILSDLGNGLVMRRSSAADADRLAAFYDEMFSDPETHVPDPWVGVWTRDMVRGDHPTIAVDDFIIVEEAATGRIASAMNLIPQTWSYGGVEFGVGRVEQVATRPDLRNRGLVRAQFDVIHRWSSERGHLVQAITGIPYFYRQFGYELALDLLGGRNGYAAVVPPLKPGESEPYRLRLPVEEDLPLVLELDAYASRRSLIWCVRDRALWRYELFGRSPTNYNRVEFRIIESATGEPVGILGHGGRLWGERLVVQLFELKPDVSWLEVLPGVLRYMRETGERFAARDGKSFTRLGLGLGREHPVYSITERRLPDRRRPFAWYLRVPDLPRFITHIGPVLEARLAASVAAGHSGELRLSFYRSGLRLVLERGRLAQVEPWQPAWSEDGSAAFPGLTFLQLLFGRCALEELERAFPDCWADTDDARALVNALFPRATSCLWGVT